MEIKRVFIDTSAWISYFLENEPDHEVVDAAFRKLIVEDWGMFTSSDVVDETVTRLVYKDQFIATKKFVKYFQEAMEQRVLVQLWVDDVAQEEALGLVMRFYEHRLSLTDATSIALIKRFKIDVILSLDDDYKKVGMK